MVTEGAYSGCVVCVCCTYEPLQPPDEAAHLRQRQLSTYAWSVPESVPWVTGAYSPLKVAL